MFEGFDSFKLDSFKLDISEKILKLLLAHLDFKTTGERHQSLNSTSTAAGPPCKWLHPHWPSSTWWHPKPMPRSQEIPAWLEGSTRPRGRKSVGNFWWPQLPRRVDSQSKTQVVPPTPEAASRAWVWGLGLPDCTWMYVCVCACVSSNVYTALYVCG